MATLSILREVDDRPIAYIAASPVFLASPAREPRNGERITFEMFARDAKGLHALLGKRERFVLAGVAPFWGELKSIEPCASTHPGLARMRDRLAVRVTLEVFQQSETRQ